MRYKTVSVGTSLAVQWLRLCAPNAGDMGSNRRTKIPHTVWHGLKKRKREKEKEKPCKCSKISTIKKKKIGLEKSGRK